MSLKNVLKLSFYENLGGHLLEGRKENIECKNKQREASIKSLQSNCFLNCFLTLNGFVMCSAPIQGIIIEFKE